MNKIETRMVSRIKEILGYAPLTQHFTVKIKSLVEEVGGIKNPKIRSDLLSRMDQMLAPFQKDEDRPNEILEKAGKMMEEFKREYAIWILFALGLAWVENGIKEGSCAGVTFIDKEGVRCFMNDGAWETISPLLDELIKRRKGEET